MEIKRPYQSGIVRYQSVKQKNARVLLRFHSHVFQKKSLRIFSDICRESDSLCMAYSQELLDSVVKEDLKE